MKDLDVSVASTLIYVHALACVLCVVGALYEQHVQDAWIPTTIVATALLASNVGFFLRRGGSLLRDHPHKWYCATSYGLSLGFYLMVLTASSHTLLVPFALLFTSMYLVGTSSYYMAMPHDKSIGAKHTFIGFLFTVFVYTVFMTVFYPQAETISYGLAIGLGAGNYYVYMLYRLGGPGPRAAKIPPDMDNDMRIAYAAMLPGVGFYYLAPIGI